MDKEQSFAIPGDAAVDASGFGNFDTGQPLEVALTEKMPIATAENPSRALERAGKITDMEGRLGQDTEALNKARMELGLPPVTSTPGLDSQRQAIAELQQEERYSYETHEYTVEELEIHRWVETQLIYEMKKLSIFDIVMLLLKGTFGEGKKFKLGVLGEVEPKTLSYVYAKMQRGEKVEYKDLGGQDGAQLAHIDEIIHAKADEFKADPNLKALEMPVIDVEAVAVQSPVENAIEAGASVADGTVRAV
jgi:hypothetical protein